MPKKSIGVKTETPRSTLLTGLKQSPVYKGCNQTEQVSQCSRRERWVNWYKTLTCACSTESLNSHLTQYRHWPEQNHCLLMIWHLYLVERHQVINIPQRRWRPPTWNSVAHAIYFSCNANVGIWSAHTHKTLTIDVNHCVLKNVHTCI